MTVNPGFGGQSFIENSLEKIAQLKEWKETKGYTYEIEVDGGIVPETAARCKEAVRKCSLQAPTFIMLKILKNESMH